MSVTWTVLASGSAGNASLLDVNQQGLLLDVGLGPRALNQRLHEAGSAWERIRGVILTHTHSDHWHPATLERLHTMQIPVYCHPEHRPLIQQKCPIFERMQFARQVTWYRDGAEFFPIEGVRWVPLSVSHDGGPTFGFRIEVAKSESRRACAMGYAADLGSWNEQLARDLSNVDLLAIEFNHDVAMQRASRRPEWLVARVLSDKGHLSNDQGAGLLDACARRSSACPPRHVVQLHLSRDCNRPELAAAAATSALGRACPGARLHTASQNEVGARIELASS
jgi:phosphoribosyl 1,2-cyclic phosphodiesterase